MNIKYSKMQSLGNDFMVIDAVNQEVVLSAAQIQQWSNRETGIGFDQLLLVEPAKSDSVDFFYRIYNADGGEVGQCGNGARCLARFIADKQISDKPQLALQTITAELTTQILDNGDVEVNLGKPQFAPEALPATFELAERYTLDINGQFVELGLVSVGNPHAVLLVDDVALANVDGLGQVISHHEVFPQQCNVGFMQIIDRGQIKLRVYERGVGETQACGSGASAAVAVGRHWQLLDAVVTVTMASGDLFVTWQNEDDDLYLSGSAEFEFDATISV